QATHSEAGRGAGETGQRSLRKEYVVELDRWNCILGKAHASASQTTMSTRASLAGNCVTTAASRPPSRKWTTPSRAMGYLHGVRVITVSTVVGPRIVAVETAILVPVDAEPHSRPGRHAGPRTLLPRKVGLGA